MGAFSVEYLNVVTDSGKNTNLYPDCLRTLEVGGSETGGEGMKMAKESESACS